MPRASIVTPQAFARTARELLAQGRPVTNDAVVELTGGGSMATLVPLLRPWRKDQKARSAREEVDLPDPVLEQVRELAIRIWRDATAEAQAAADALRRELRDLRLWAEGLSRSAALAPVAGVGRSFQRFSMWPGFPG